MLAALTIQGLWIFARKVDRQFLYEQLSLASRVTREFGGPTEVGLEPPLKMRDCESNDLARSSDNTNVRRLPVESLSIKRTGNFFNFEASFPQFTF